MKVYNSSNLLSGDNSFARFIAKKSNTIVESIAALFILLFLYTAVTKTYDISPTITVIKKTPLFSSYTNVTAWGVVIIEYAITILLFMPRTRNVGLYASGSLMTVFLVYVGYMKFFVPNLPCSCGGVISKMTWNQHLLFNLLFTLLAVAAIILNRQRWKNDTDEVEAKPIVFT